MTLATVHRGLEWYDDTRILEATAIGQDKRVIFVRICELDSTTASAHSSVGKGPGDQQVPEACI